MFIERLGHISKQGSTLLRFFWWRQPKPRRASIQNGAASFYTWRCGVNVGSPK